MAKKKPKNEKPKNKADPKTCQVPPAKRTPPATVIVRPTATATRKSEAAAVAKPATTDASTAAQTAEPERSALTERIAEMDTSHVAVAAGASVLATGGSVYMVSKGWLSPKAASGVVMGLGVATAAAGYHWDQDYALAAGTGMTAAGGVMLSGQYAVDWYQTLEKRKAERKAKKEAKAQDKDKSQDSGDDSKQGRRNARRIVIQPQRTDDDHDDERDEYPAQAA